MRRTITFLASLALAVSVTVIAVAAWGNRPTDSFFDANLEALAAYEGTLQIACDCYSYVVICKHNCVNCGREVQAKGGYGFFDGFRGTCECGHTY